MLPFWYSVIVWVVLIAGIPVALYNLPDVDGIIP